MAHLTDDDWQEYIDIIDEFHEDANQQEVIWRKLTNNFNRWGEDGGETYEDIPTLGLVQYNFFRSWAINKTTSTGELDKESCMVFFNQKYLSDNGWLTTNNQFKFRPGEDRFIIDGELYKARGNSKAAQANDQTLLIFIILKREETDTGNLVYE